MVEGFYIHYIQELHLLVDILLSKASVPYLNVVSTSNEEITKMLGQESTMSVSGIPFISADIACDVFQSRLNGVEAGESLCHADLSEFTGILQ